MVEAVIFDWAGTTVDYGSMSPILAFAEAFGAFDIHPTEAEIRQPMGIAKLAHIRTMLQGKRLQAEWQRRYGHLPTETDVQAVYGRFQQAILQVLGKYSTLKPQVGETVEQLRQAGIKIGSTTGYNDAMMQIVREAAAAQGYAPDYWISPDGVDGMGRTYPYMIFQNLEALQVSGVRQAVKVGDTLADIVEGQRAGVRTIGVIEGSSLMGRSQAAYEALPYEEREAACEEVQRLYEKAGADYTVRSFQELPVVLQRIGAEK